jgi:hypothetical protein
MRFACCITTATDTHSEYVILITFPRQQRFRERACLTFILHCLSCFRIWKELGYCSQSTKLYTGRTGKFHRVCARLWFPLSYNSTSLQIQRQVSISCTNNVDHLSGILKTTMNSHKDVKIEGYFQSSLFVSVCMPKVSLQTLQQIRLIKLRKVGTTQA